MYFSSLLGLIIYLGTAMGIKNISTTQVEIQPCFLI